MSTMDAAPRDEPLDQIAVVPHAQELSQGTVERLHSDQELTDRDKTLLRKWAEVHGYAPHRLAETQNLRLVEDCEYPNHRPIIGHWQADCNDHNVAVPDQLNGWERYKDTHWWVPVAWHDGNEFVGIEGRYGDWTAHATDDRLDEPLIEDASAELTMTVAISWMHPTRHVSDEPDWFDEFPQTIGEYERYDTPDQYDTPMLFYYPENRYQLEPVAAVRIEPDGEQFICREKIEVDRQLTWTDTADSILFQRADAEPVATMLEHFLCENPDPFQDEDMPPAEEPQGNVPWPPRDMFTDDSS